MASLREMGGGKWALIMILLVVLVYLPSLPGDFHFDDYLLLLDNPDVSAPSFRFANLLDHYGGRPLTLLTFHWNYRLAGRNPAGYVAVDLILHLLACLLLFGWIRGRTRNNLLAFGTALLFGIHPLQTQAVNYIWSRSMLLMAVFVLAALWLAAGPEPSRNRKSSSWSGRSLAALGLFQLAIWSRTEALAVAPFLVVQGIPTTAVAVVAGLNLVGFLSGLFEHAPAATALRHPDIVGYWLSQPPALLKYLFMMVLPTGLRIDHDFRPSLGTSLAAVIILGLLLAAFLRRSGSGSDWRWAGLWMLLLFLPSALIPNEDTFNESRVYLAMAGFSYLAVRAWLGLSGSTSWQGLAKWVAWLLLPTMALGSALRNRQWNDNLSLWQEAARSYPEKLRIQYNLGHAYLLEEQLEPAEAAFQRALRLNNSDDLSYAALGYCAEVKEDWTSAKALYRRAFELNPDNAYAARGLQRMERRGIVDGSSAAPEERH